MNALILENLDWAAKCGLGGDELWIKGKRYIHSQDIVICEAKYSPGIAVVLEILHRKLQIDAAIRVATCGALRDVPIGSIFIFEGAIRDEGTSLGYAQDGVPAIPDLELTQAFKRELDIRDSASSLVLVWTTDCRFREMEKLDEMRGLGAVAVDMETSAMYVVGRMLGVATASVGIVTDILDPSAGEAEQFFFDEPDELLLGPMRSAIECGIRLLSG